MLDIIPGFVVDFFSRYGLDVWDVTANAAIVLGVVQVVKQYIPQVNGHWTWGAAVLVALAVAYMAYGPLGYVSVVIATVTMAVTSVIGKGWLNQFIPGKSIKDKRNGTTK